MAGRKPEVERSELLRRFLRSSDPALGAKEIAGMLGMSRQGVDYRLRELHEEGLVDSKIVSREWIWWLTDEGEAYLAGELVASGLDRRDDRNGVVFE